MIDQKLVNYINQQLSQGYDMNAIKTGLIKQGWDQGTINDSINSLSNQNVNYKEQTGGNNMVDMKNPQYGGFWKRVLALFLDGIIIGIPASAIGFGLAFATGVVSITYLVQLGAIALVIYLDGIKGGTPGKQILGMRIVNEQGNFIGIPMAILRYIARIVSGALLGIGLIMVAFTQKKQGLHDLIAKTYVVKV